MGVEPMNGGFANRSVRPLRHCTELYMRNKLVKDNYLILAELFSLFKTYSYINFWYLKPSAGRRRVYQF